MAGVRVSRLETDAIDLPITPDGGRARAVLHPAMGARERGLIYLELPPGTAAAPLRHPMEAVYYVASGQGAVEDLDRGVRTPLGGGRMIYLAAGQGYRLWGPAVFVGGPCPPDPALLGDLPLPAGEHAPLRGRPTHPTTRGGAAASPSRGEAAASPTGARPARSPAAPGVRVLDPQHDGVPMPMIARRSWLVVSPHMGAERAVMNLVELAAGERNVPHVHDASEDSLFVLEGTGWAYDLDDGTRLPLAPGCALVVPPGVRHIVEAGAQGLRSVGGPVPPDRAMLRAMGIAV